MASALALIGLRPAVASLHQCGMRPQPEAVERIVVRLSMLADDQCSCLGEHWQLIAGEPGTSSTSWRLTRGNEFDIATPYAARMCAVEFVLRLANKRELCGASCDGHRNRILCWPCSGGGPVLRRSMSDRRMRTIRCS